MKYTITHTTKYKYSDAVPVCHNIVHLQPRSKDTQRCEDFRLLIHPEPFEIRNQLDAFGNHATYFSIEQAHMGLTVTATSKVAVSKVKDADSDISWNHIAGELNEDRSPDVFAAYEFSFPTRRTRPFRELDEYARESFPPDRSIIEAAKDLTSRIHRDFQYDPKATNVSTPITEAFARRKGVCQDFAHIQLACFRSLGLAARYVSGYLRTYPPAGEKRMIGADESHAWISLFCGEAGWIDFDPTNDLIPSTDHVSIAWGRDYSDVCPIRGVILGGGSHQMSVSVDVAPA